ncbi:MAG TPA: hypothetical protein VMG10_04880 [Gemmataceae bacterium]|nr:hypothetical protein [Gemmataceae bacterium]
MAQNLTEAINNHQHLVALAEVIRTNGFDRSYLTPDGQGYALAVQGEGARAMSDFMKAVGQYLMTVQFTDKWVHHDHEVIGA